MLWFYRCCVKGRLKTDEFLMNGRRERGRRKDQDAQTEGASTKTTETLAIRSESWSPGKMADRSRLSDKSLKSRPPSADSHSQQGIPQSVITASSLALEPNPFIVRCPRRWSHNYLDQKNPYVTIIIRSGVCPCLGSE